MVLVSKREKCKTGKGTPCTQGEPKYFSSEDNEGYEKYIRLADSRGIEKGEYGVNEVVNSAKKFINFYLEKKSRWIRPFNLVLYNWHKIRKNWTWIINWISKIIYCS